MWFFAHSRNLILPATIFKEPYNELDSSVIFMGPFQLGIFCFCDSIKCLYVSHPKTMAEKREMSLLLCKCIREGGRRNPEIPPKQEVVLFKLCSDPISVLQWPNLSIRSTDSRAEHSITNCRKKETPHPQVQKTALSSASLLPCSWRSTRPHPLGTECCSWVCQPSRGCGVRKESNVWTGSSAAESVSVPR